MVKTLAGRAKTDVVTEVDFSVAARTIKGKFIVGLMDQMEESVHRFNVFMGIDEAVEINKECMDHFFGHGVKRENANSHPKVEIESPAWQVLARDNALDIRLYESIVEAFDHQREIIEGYARAMAVGND
mmetsp:Transcript_27484/g.58388  ORF Transcript_27484/g.58388 Transcript_27484/m.58388 type:complete len:129 (-) Transcript_27484:264-650(-)